MAHFRQGLRSGDPRRDTRAAHGGERSPRRTGLRSRLLAPALAFLTLVIREDGARSNDKNLLTLIFVTPPKARAGQA